MKYTLKKFITFSIIMLSFTTIAQEVRNTEAEKVESNKEGVYNSSGLAKQPEYSDGGMHGFYNYLNSNFKIPKVKEDMTARIYVSFIIEKDGAITNIKILRSPNEELSTEATRVLNSTNKKWTPGERADGEVVRTNYNLPITINIKN